MVHHYRVVEDPGEGGPWKVRTAAYYYPLHDSNDQEVISYHWHPESQSPVQFPHLHLGPGAGCQRNEIGAAHCPTGRISIEIFLRFAIVDFRVEPLRPDWSEYLRKRSGTLSPGELGRNKRGAPCYKLRIPPQVLTS